MATIFCSHCFVAALYLFILNSEGKSLRFSKQRLLRQYSCQDKKIVDKELCARIMSQPVLHQSLNLLQKASENELFRSRRKRSPTRCPVMDQDYLDAHRSIDAIGERSLSPFEYIPDVNRHRFPEVIYKARCLCGGCIDTGSRKETNDLDSFKILRTTKVLMKVGDHYRLADENFAVGCTCIIAP